MADTKITLRHQSDFEARLPNVLEPSVSNGQTIFTLLEDALADNMVFEVNSVSYFPTTYFTITGSGNRTITWLNNLFALDTSDVVRIKYYPAN